MRRSNSTPPIIVLGLGNPGPKFERTRHNVGYWVVDQLMKKPPTEFRRRLFASYAFAELTGGENNRPIITVRYDGFMNNSGCIISALKRRYRAVPEDLLVVVDNMDLRPGICRIRKGGGTAGHNGLKSVVKHVGSGDFMRLYIGVGRPLDGVGVVEHVIGEPENQDAAAIIDACTRGADAIRRLAYTPFQQVAEGLNRRDG
ncbi:MAG: aminoacyl-tRNA hydrolase [Spirochaetaceae bacterium]|nr:aminoacyl-tRNA hydrolase [Spirochaetaceae bacterium]